jgi:hypothetical protein
LFFLLTSALGTRRVLLSARMRRGKRCSRTEIGFETTRHPRCGQHHHVDYVLIS